MNTIKLNIASLGDEIIIKKGGGGGAGGDTPSGGGKGYYYISASAMGEAAGKLDNNLVALFAMSISIYVTYAKVIVEGQYNIVGGYPASEMMTDPTTTIFGISRDLRMGTKESLVTFDEMLQAFPQELRNAWESIPKLTEEEFYTLE